MLLLSKVGIVVMRVLQGMLVVVGIMTVAFLLLQFAPGDAASVLAGEAGGASPEYVAELRTRFGLDQPVFVQLLKYLGHTMSLDLGYSFRFGLPVTDLILQRLGPTLLLMSATLVLSTTLGIFLGLIAALNVNTWKDNLISTLGIVLYATPLFWVGLMLILLFGVKLNWLPVNGMEDVAGFYEGWDRIKDILRHLILPTLSLAPFYMAIYIRLMRASVLEQSTSDYVLTARSKGLSPSQVIRRHVLRNAILPVVTMISVQLGSLLGGSVVVESVFGWPGLGLLAYQSLFARDLNLLLGIFMCSAVLVVMVNGAIDLVYGLIDPRMRRSP